MFKMEIPILSSYSFLRPKQSTPPNEHTQRSPPHHPITPLKGNVIAFDGNLAPVYKLRPILSAFLACETREI